MPLPMRITPISNLDELDRWAADWDRLAAGAPFRGHTWNTTWWRHYGQEGGGRERRLFVLLVQDLSGDVVGLAPWYGEHSTARGRVVRTLGSGEACADYLGVPCLPGREDDVAETLAQWLAATRDATDSPERWDRIELKDIDAADPVVARMAERLAAWGNVVHSRPGPSGWRIELPGTVDQYVARCSKNARRKFRRIQRNWLDSGRATLETARTAAEVDRAMEILIDLHQRRQQSRGRRGCFSSPTFAAFHLEVAKKMLLQGQTLLHVLRVDGRPVAADYHFAGGGTVYVYQGGIEPERLDVEPGHLMTAATLRWAIENGYRAFDLMRGDEPYKMHWQARRTGNREYRVVAPRPAALLRHTAWLAGVGARDWIRSWQGKNTD